MEVRHWSIDHISLTDSASPCPRGRDKPCLTGTLSKLLEKRWLRAWSQKFKLQHDFMRQTTRSLVPSEVLTRVCTISIFLFYPSRLFSSPFYLSFLVVTQIRGRIAGSSPFSTPWFVACILVVRRLQPILPASIVTSPAFVICMNMPCPPVPQSQPMLAS